MDHPQTLLTEPAWYPMIDHLRERIQLAMRIERKIRQEIFIEESGVSNFRSFRFNPIQLAGLLCTDIVRLRGLARAPAIDRVYNALVSMESFLACSKWFYVSLPSYYESLLSRRDYQFCANRLLLP